MKKQIVFSLLLSFCGMALGNQAQSDTSAIQKAKALYEQAMRFHAQDDFEKVVDYCKQAVQLYPEYTEAHREIIDHVPDKNWLLQEYARRAREKPASPVYHYLLGRAQTDMAQKEASFRKSVELDSSYVWGHLGMAYVYLQKEMFEAAEKSYKKIIKLDSLNENGYDGLANLYRQQGKAEAVQKVYETMARTIPDKPLGYFRLAGFYERDLNKPEEAAKIYKTIYERFPDDEVNAAMALFWYANTISDTTQQIELLQTFL